MSIKDWSKKIKLSVSSLKDRFSGNGATSRYYTATIVILVGLSSFGLGRLSIQDDNKEPIIIEESSQMAESSTIADAFIAGKLQVSAVSKSVSAPTAQGGKIVASKNGTKYYFPWCSGASRIADTNKIWFNSEAEARSRGLQPAANCKGLR